jgi:hypothetical protein
MLKKEMQIQYTSNQTRELLALMQTMVSITNLSYFNRQVLPALARILKPHWIGLYIADSRLRSPLYFSNGLSDEVATYMERSCAIEFNSFSNYPDLQYSIPATAFPHIFGNQQYFPVLCGRILIGLLHLEANVNITDPEQWGKFLIMVSDTINRLLDGIEV